LTVLVIIMELFITILTNLTLVLYLVYKTGIRPFLKVKVSPLFHMNQWFKAILQIWLSTD